MAFLGRFRLLATPALFLEYEEVLKRPEQLAVHKMPPARIHEFLVGLAGIIEPVRIFYQWRPQLGDADDEMVLESALNGQADAIVTHNLRDFSSASVKFNVRLMCPAAMVRELDQ